MSILLPRVRVCSAAARAFRVQRSNAYASSISRGSLHARPVKLTPNGAGFALNPAGNGGVGAFGTIPNGTMTVGYPTRAAIAGAAGAGKQQRVEPLGVHHLVDAVRAGQQEVLRPVRLVARAIALDVHLVGDVEVRSGRT